MEADEELEQQIPALVETAVSGLHAAPSRNPDSKTLYRWTLSLDTEEFHDALLTWLRDPRLT